MRVLVTGGAAFIGSHVVEALTAAGHEAVVSDLRDGLDVRRPQAVASALPYVDAVCHQAAMVELGTGFGDAADYVSHNDLGTAALLTAMADAGLRRLVLAGSMVVYGEAAYACAEHGPVRPGPRSVADPGAGRFEPRCPRCGEVLTPGLVGEDASVDPRNVYATAKLTQEHLAAAWARSPGGSAVSRATPTCTARMPRDTPYAGVASFFLSALARGESPRVFEDGGGRRAAGGGRRAAGGGRRAAGGGRRDIVHIRDVAAANVAALESEPQEGASAAAYGGPALVVTRECRLGDVRHITADSSRLRAELGWKAEVECTEGMREFATSKLRGEQ
ncbi:NAD-dependent epimerase/dehydratase family protein [Streptomyces sp. SAS_260]|uniref:NAD-dependent epimerase/dehydratase family protein n=1 Tax=Streptomyces sp. SAS_260 TaxID=3412751 RepID=UPI00403CEC3F